MPPSHHSSSHHSSSHHSSHSSSHHSSRSHSSHSSSHHSSYSSSRYSSSRSGSSYRPSTPISRTRTSQPYGWVGGNSGNPTRYLFMTHDYDYYPQGWTAPDGRSFAEGYYDENGQYYSNIVAAGATTMLHCAYCGNHMLYTWKDGAIPTCDKCGAQFQIDATDRAQPAGVSAPPTAQAKIIKTIICVFAVYFGISILSSLLSLLRMGWVASDSSGRQIAQMVQNSQESPDGRSNGDASGAKVGNTKNSIYVEEIGRTCYLDGSDWYDSATECWFWFNDEEAPAQWQYWFEGISSDYGEFGWMEYDMNEGAWYIEASEGNWVHLPDSYDISGLWHMTDEYTNAY